jgi:hypothetical protein
MAKKPKQKAWHDGMDLTGPGLGMIRRTEPERRERHMSDGEAKAAKEGERETDRAIKQAYKDLGI